MGKLHVRAADYLYRFHNPVSLLLQTFLALLRDSQHGRGAERVSRMNPKRIYVFNEADGDNIVVRIPDHLKLQLFPAQNGLLHKHLTHKACL